jgi:hypothetical protein
MLKTYEEFAQFARLCWKQAKLANTNDVAQTLRRMAMQYQQAAARLDSGKLPDLEHQ